MPSNTQCPTVVFINPPGPAKLYRSIICTYISKANYIWQPQDFINLSAQIPREYELKLIDCSISRRDQESLLAELRQYAPEIAVVALSSIVFDHDLLFLKALKLTFPDMKCLALGDILLEPVFWDRVLEYADGLILNSLDVDLTNYIKNYTSNSPNLILKEQKERGKVITQKVSIGIPRHELFLNRTYRFPFVKSYIYSTVSSQFSCPYRCKYCSSSKIPVTYRDASEVLEELAYVRRLGVRDIFFGDFSFGFPTDNATHILEGMIRRQFAMRWVCFTHPALIDRDLLKLMKAAGCHTVMIGVDDDDTEMLEKQYHRVLPKSRLLQFCEQCHRLNIQISGDFIIGLNSDKTAINRMIELAKRLKLDYASFNVFTVLLGSVVREELIKQGTFDPYAIGLDTSGSSGERNHELIRLRNLAVKNFYLRPEYLVRRLFSIRSIPEFVIQAEEMIVMLRNLLKSFTGRDRVRSQPAKKLN